MIPSAFIEVEEIPMTPSGKVDRKTLIKIQNKRPLLSNEYQTPHTELEKLMVQIWSHLLQMDKVGVIDSFFDLGGNSLLALRFLSQLQKEKQLEVSITTFFSHPTIAGLAQKIESPTSSKDRSSKSLSNEFTKTGKRDLAIIGMAGRFPGAHSVDELWKNLCAGEESITFFDKSELHPSLQDEANQPDYVCARGLMPDADKFDAAFFGISPREAELMDPQQRVFLEIVWAGLEDAGYINNESDQKVGVFAGMANNAYYPQNVQKHPELIKSLGTFQVMIGNEKDYIATRASHKLNLQGPSISVHTGCSTSLVAVHLAAQSIFNGECNLAVAGGIAIGSPQKAGYLYQEGGIFSRDGHCRPFDAKASGTLFNDGAGVIVLKPLERAEQDGDQIYAVLKGSAINNDGADKVSFTAPSVEGQADVITAAQQDAGVDPATIGYVEAHGTATPLGDPIEVEALKSAFQSGTDENGFCFLGSIKSNIGHLTSAAGIAGLIKAALAIKHNKIPPTLYFEKANPQIDFANSPFKVNSQLEEWKSFSKLRAGVSSFGVGGTNAHVILEEANERKSKTSVKTVHPLFLSAKTETERAEQEKLLNEFLLQDEALEPADIAYTLGQGRQRFKYRSAGVFTGEIKKYFKGETIEQPRQIAFMFPGQGAQYVNMGHNLYVSQPLFKKSVDRCCDILQSHMGIDLRSILYPADSESKEAIQSLNETRYTQPALFIIEYSLAKLWLNWGLKPQFFIGHSIGEFVAACLAEVFSLEDALKLVAHRGSLMWDLPRGSMLTVRLAAQKIEQRLCEKLSVAAINGPELCVVAGPDPEIDELMSILQKEEIFCKKLHTSHAFHSSMMDPIVEPFYKIVKEVHLSAPKIPIVSTVTAEWMKDEEAKDPRYWAEHLRNPVRFAEGVQTLWKDPTHILLEVGPRKTATTLAKQQAKDKVKQVAIASLGSHPDQNQEWISLGEAICQLWVRGISIDLTKYYQGEKRGRVSLPTYPFARNRYWLDEPQQLKSGQYSQTQPIQKEGTMSLLIEKLKQTFEEASGMDFTEIDKSLSFLELGLDSLFLTQIALKIKNEFEVKITFRQLLEEYSNLELLSDYIKENSPLDFTPAPSSEPEVPVALSSSVQAGNLGSVEQLIAKQIEVMNSQLETLRTVNGQSAKVPVKKVQTSSKQKTPIKAEVDNTKKAFGAIARISLANAEMDGKQQRTFEQFLLNYNEKTKTSKKLAQENRKHLADPRVVTGFKPKYKELTYPIHVTRSEESYLYDVDGNKYIDLINGFGSSYFGYLPAFIKDEVDKQMNAGIEIGPQHPLAGEVGKMICEMVDLDRVTFCNTGSEAVMGAMRLARTVTGRTRIVAFSGSYHGIVDEVISRGTPKFTTIPCAPGIMPSSVENMLILEYGTDASLKIIEDNIDDIAAVMVEPVQSRRPDFQPKEFLHKLRAITSKNETALIFDEVITGFRLHPGGAQKFYDIKADLATYGKVIGGGMPIGVIAGIDRFMDALDGGFWQFGDDSTPQVGVTYFAGTFVRHPLALAAAKAAVTYMKQQGPALQQGINDKANAMVKEMNDICKSLSVPVKVVNCGSLFKIKPSEELPFADLIFPWMRYKGIHVWEGFPCFITTAHTPEDLKTIVQVFTECLKEMQEAGYLPPGESKDSLASCFDQNKPPVPGARLGKDENGYPAWFVPDENKPGAYLKLEMNE